MGNHSSAAERVVPFACILKFERTLSRPYQESVAQIGRSLSANAQVAAPLRRCWKRQHLADGTTMTAHSSEHAHTPDPVTPDIVPLRGSSTHTALSVQDHPNRRKDSQPFPR